MFNRIILLSVLMSVLISFSSLAMTKHLNVNEPEQRTPSTETEYDEQNLNYKWTWINDTLCVRFQLISFSENRERLERIYNLGLLTPWRENGEDKARDIYTGKWSQNKAGIWSFVFDDCTIPVGVTKIDGVLYAFNGFGELIDGYNYWGDLKTAADGLVVTDNAELNKWLETEYLPECTSHE